MLTRSSGANVRGRWYRPHDSVLFGGLDGWLWTVGRRLYAEGALKHARETADDAVKSDIGLVLHFGPVHEGPASFRMLCVL